MIHQPFRLDTLCLFLDRSPLRECSLLHHAVLFAVRDLSSRKVLVIFLSKIFLVLFLCCSCGVEIVFCVCISVVAQSSLEEDGSSAWFGPLESLLWSRLFLVSVATNVSHTKQLLRSTFQH